MSVFSSADILLPSNTDLSKWSVIACDQFTSDRAYWQRVKDTVGDSASALRLILPESMLSSPEAANAASGISALEHEYLSSGFFTKYPDSFILTERKLPDGKVRRGLIGKIDLDEYEFEPSADAALKASERTVHERLMKRFELQRTAPLDLPHVIVFVDDPLNLLGNLLSVIRDSLPVVYDFELMQGGGHITGRLVKDFSAAELSVLFESLEFRLRSETQPGACPAVYAVGDGNHSLASAKQRWNEIKEKLNEEEKRNHPARFSLVELVNVYDEAISILPIHRVVSGVDPAHFVSGLNSLFAESSEPSCELRLVTASSSSLIKSGCTVSESISAVDGFITGYISAYGGNVDFIHDDEAAISLAADASSCAVLFPPISRGEIFDIVRKHSVFPKKCFSIGHAVDKRYYLEARSLLP